MIYSQCVIERLCQIHLLGFDCSKHRAVKIVDRSVKGAINQIEENRKSEPNNNKRAIVDNRERMARSERCSKPTIMANNNGLRIINSHHVGLKRAEMDDFKRIYGLRIYYFLMLIEVGYLSKPFE